MTTHLAVVGGGFAGLAAAFELFNFGFAATVIEAQQSEGGCVWSAKLPDVRLGHVVTAVAYHQIGASIKGELVTGAFDVAAEAIILAIPVKLLSEREFNPVLPRATEEAISSVPIGIAAKLVMGTQNPPPPRANQDLKLPYWSWTGKGEGGVPRSAVTAFCGFEQTQQKLAINSSDPSIWLDNLQSTIADLNFVNDPIMVDWSRDEWAGGCYSALDNKSRDLMPLQSQPVGRIFFTGEHTAVDTGTMEGALASGLLAARQISEVLQ
jgi:monoamine oxidase